MKIISLFHLHNTDYITIYKILIWHIIIEIYIDYNNNTDRFNNLKIINFTYTNINILIFSVLTDYKKIEWKIFM